MFKIKQTFNVNIFVFLCSPPSLLLQFHPLPKKKVSSIGILFSQSENLFQLTTYFLSVFYVQDSLKLLTRLKFGIKPKSSVPRFY